ncbi:hypothetical protein [Maritimibacter sp. 55A14]|uniref:hypothetical protein n=1 Tax=Maritimibacter sp. 55A14 TaxID=2174844 RepID=UPI0011B223C9|nr:hypothetical protein [Maritimibacter sp. 55A14]
MAHRGQEFGLGDARGLGLARQIAGFQRAPPQIVLRALQFLVHLLLRDIGGDQVMLGVVAFVVLKVQPVEEPEKRSGEDDAGEEVDQDFRGGHRRAQELIDEEPAQRAGEDHVFDEERLPVEFAHEMAVDRGRGQECQGEDPCFLPACAPHHEDRAGYAERPEDRTSGQPAPAAPRFLMEAGLPVHMDQDGGFAQFARQRDGQGQRACTQRDDPGHQQPAHDLVGDAQPQEAQPPGAEPFHPAGCGVFPVEFGEAILAPIRCRPVLHPPSSARSRAGEQKPEPLRNR